MSAKPKLEDFRDNLVALFQATGDPGDPHCESRFTHLSSILQLNEEEACFDLREIARQVPETKHLQSNTVKQYSNLLAQSAETIVNDEEGRDIAHQLASRYSGPVAAAPIFASVNTPLHQLCCMPVMNSALRLRTLELLLRSGANPNAINLRGQRPIHLCIEFGIEDIFNRLLQLHDDGVFIDLSASDRFGRTVFGYCIDFERWDMLKAYGRWNAILEILTRGALLGDRKYKQIYHSLSQPLESSHALNGESSRMSSSEADLTRLSIAEDCAEGSTTDGEILNAEQLAARNREYIEQTQRCLGIRATSALALLRVYDYHTGELFADFFKDPSATFAKASLPYDSKVEHGEVDICPLPESAVDGANAVCNICLEEIANEEILAMTCHHTFCKPCWTVYISGKITEGNVRQMICPFHQCNILVPEEIIQSVSTPEQIERYKQFLVRSFVEDDPRVKFCPAPDCEMAVQYSAGTVDEASRSGDPLTPAGDTNDDGARDGAVHKRIDVTCTCGHTFCWNCKEPGHFPCDCEQAKQFSRILEDHAANGTWDWIYSNTRDCPRCSSHIEKNAGCNHMTCTHCRHQFCWQCMQPWAEHNTNTGGAYRCNRFREQKKYTEENQERVETAKERRARYTFYAQKVKSGHEKEKCHSRLQEYALEGISFLENAHVDLPGAEPLRQAVTRLVRAQVLSKNIYMYIYFLPDGHDKRLMEYLQGKLEEATEALASTLGSFLSTIDEQKSSLSAWKLAAGESEEVVEPLPDAVALDVIGMSATAARHDRNSLLHSADEGPIAYVIESLRRSLVLRYTLALCAHQNVLKKHVRAVTKAVNDVFEGFRSGMQPGSQTQQVIEAWK